MIKHVVKNVKSLKSYQPNWNCKFGLIRKIKTFKLWQLVTFQPFELEQINMQLKNSENKWLLNKPYINEVILRGQKKATIKIPILLSRDYDILVKRKHAYFYHWFLFWKLFFFDTMVRKNIGLASSLWCKMGTFQMSATLFNSAIPSLCSQSMSLPLMRAFK